MQSIGEMLLNYNSLFHTVDDIGVKASFRTRYGWRKEKNINKRIKHKTERR